MNPGSRAVVLCLLPCRQHLASELAYSICSITYLMGMNEFPSYFVTLHWAVSSYFSQISFSDLYFFLCPFCTTLHRVLPSFSYFSVIKTCGFDAFYLGADGLLVCNSGPIPFHITSWTFVSALLVRPINKFTNTFKSVCQKRHVLSSENHL